MFVLFKDTFPKLFHTTMLCNWRLWLCRKRALAVLEIFPRDKKNVVILGGIRTRDLWIRSPARYPLRYEDITLLHIIWLLILHRSSLLHGLFPLSLAFILSKLPLVGIESENYWKTFWHFCIVFQYSQDNIMYVEFDTGSCSSFSMSLQIVLSDKFA